MECSNPECGQPIETLKGTAYEEIGWVVPRKTGGTHHLMGRRRTGRLLCSGCTIKLMHGITKDQLTLI